METDKKQSVRLDMSINLGHIISLISFLASMAFVWINFTASVSVQANDIQNLKQENIVLRQAYITQQEVNIKMAVTMERITTIIDLMRESNKPKEK